MSKMKKYESGGGIAINVVTKNGGNAFVSFNSTSKGSVYWTDDENIQYGIEHHRYFGTVIKLAWCDDNDEDNENTEENTEHETAAGMDPEGEHAAGMDNVGDDEESLEAVDYTRCDADEAESNAEEGGDGNGETKVVVVSGADDAVEYLMNNYDVKAREVRSLKTIRQVALEHGIVFEGLD